MAKRRKARKAPREQFVRPTPEREAHNTFQSAGAAVRAVPPIYRMLEAGKITARQFDALNYYRTQAQQAEDDSRQSSPLDPERIMGGTGGNAAGAIPIKLLSTPAIMETARIERDLGRLREIVRFVAVEDRTLTEWCIKQHGGRERYGPGGRFIAIVPRAEKRVMADALLELKVAAGMIT